MKGMKAGARQVLLLPQEIFKQTFCTKVEHFAKCQREKCEMKCE